MAVNVKSYWITVTEGYFNTIERKQFFKVDEANKYFLEMKEKYPTKAHNVVKENY